LIFGVPTEIEAYSGETALGLFVIPARTGDWSPFASG